MAAALATFERYVPRTLVRNLVLLGDGAGGARRRELTIMFLDLEGYSRFAEERPAQEVSDYLNEMFRLIGPLIEETGGAIDKYTGDGLMAFWGLRPPIRITPVTRRSRRFACMPACRLAARRGERRVYPRAAFASGLIQAKW